MHGLGWKEKTEQIEGDVFSYTTRGRVAESHIFPTRMVTEVGSLA
jgi:hypothetical protein